MKKQDESIDQRIAAFINRKSKQSPDIHLQDALKEEYALRSS